MLSAQSKSRVSLSSLVMFFLLVGGFAASVSLFHYIDFYHLHFFDNGAGVFAYNAMRTLIACYVIWILHATGYAVITWFVPISTREAYSTTEKFVLGFGVGLGCWHLFMFVLGCLNLYYSPVIFALCLLILLFSVTHFHDMWRASRANASLKMWPVFLTLMAGLYLLLIVRGLYPSGGGDYYTHYFYYYTNVLANHGLAPNDVWYHYFYSKGAGLHFLGMLLMDPLAPSLMTYCSVAVATIAIYNLVQQWQTHYSLWPLTCALLYIFFNLVSLTNDGGEFAKVHEETTAIVVLCIYAVCLYAMKPKAWERASFIMLNTLIAGVAILTQAIAVYFAFFFGAQVVLALLAKQWRKFYFYFLSGAVATFSVLGVFYFNYLVTGIATDQMINLTWKYANLERLHSWGVIPNVMLVAWIRDNYDMVAVPWTFSTVFGQLVSFMRADMLKVLLYGTLFISLLHAVTCVYRKYFRSQQNVAPVTHHFLPVTLFNIGLFIIIVAVLSVFAGHSQAVSYFRFCTFFFPLLVLFCAGAFILGTASERRYMHLFLPLLMLVLVVNSWQNWHSMRRIATKHAEKFVKGRYSVAEAYQHQMGGLRFGGIHPGVYAAMQQVPAGSRVWSTNVDSYCMAPDCQVESTISFKMSSNINEILNFPPAEAKKILQADKLNYFIISSQSRLIDLLPFSQLFHPSNLSKYFSIKWTDGNIYLLTWKDPNLMPVDRAFIDKYKKLLAEANHPWFRFNEAVPAMNQTMKLISSQQHPWRPIEFPWRIDSNASIKVHHAAYGRNCIIKNSLVLSRLISANNATEAVKSKCQNKKICEFHVKDVVSDDKRVNCDKSFKLSYYCQPDTIKRVAYIPAESKDKIIKIDCGRRHAEIS